MADYLPKPVEAERLREVVVGEFAGDSDRHWRGRSAGFAGTGGSGATTLLAATAITAAARGRYVAVLDLNRAFSALPFLLDVQPAPGFDELIESAAVGVPDPDLIEAAQVSRSDRIAVYGYRWNPLLPMPASFRNLRLLVADLCKRFHLVLVDPEAPGRVPVLRDCDVQVLVTEPTRVGALTRCPGRWPPWVRAPPSWRSATARVGSGAPKSGRRTVHPAPPGNPTSRSRSRPRCPNSPTGGT